MENKVNSTVERRSLHTLQRTKQPKDTNADAKHFNTRLNTDFQNRSNRNATNTGGPVGLFGANANTQVGSQNTATNGTAQAPTLQDNMNDFHDLYVSIQNNHPNWDQSRILSELRKIDYGSNDPGPWDELMPFNQGDSQLSPQEQRDFQDIRRSMLAHNDLDIAHVVVAMDVEQSFNTFPASAASWAGDLGSGVRLAYENGTNFDINTNANTRRADMMADIDGVNIANHMESGHEMDALFDYYLGNGQHNGGITMNERYTTFCEDHNLLSEEGRVKSDAAEEIDGAIERFFYADNAKENMKHLKRVVTEGRVPNDVDFVPTSDIPDLIDASADQFIDMLSQGLDQENLAKMPEPGGWGTLTEGVIPDDTWGQTDALIPEDTWGQTDAATPEDTWGQTEVEIPDDTWGQTEVEIPDDTWGQTDAVIPDDTWGQTDVEVPEDTWGQTDIEIPDDI